MSFKIVDDVLKKYVGDEETVVIPDGIKKIYTYAFEGITTLKCVIIPSSVEIIADSAFYKCLFLEKATILGNAVVEEYAFYKCKRLRTLDIPMGLKNIKHSAFIGCESLELEFLKNRSYELNTYIGDVATEKILSLNNKNMEKRSYSWEEYKRIMSEALKYDLIHIEEEYDDYFGGYEKITKINVPISDERVLVRDGKFIGCVEKTENVTYFSGLGLESDISYDIVRTDSVPVRIYSNVGNHCVVYMHNYVDALLKKSNDEWEEESNA